MKITHLSTYDVAGGAARAAYRLHRELRSIGHDSRLMALYKSSADDTVIEFSPSRRISRRVKRGLTRRFLELNGRAIADRPAGATTFSDDRSQHGADVLGQLPRSDLVNLHWVVNFFDHREFFRTVPANLPIVWTLHDMNPFTGGCHYDEGCGKFSSQCGACPQLGSLGATDFSSKVWSRKRRAYSFAAARRLRLVTPSCWLAREVRKSSLFSEHPVSVIPNGIDLDTFQPRDRRIARDKYSIPQNVQAVLFVADSTKEHRKGMHILLEALRNIGQSRDVLLIAVGGKPDASMSGERFKWIEPVSDDDALSYVFSAADVFVVPSLQDNLPNTAVEALACGIPTIASKVGGIPEIVREGETGCLVPAGDWRALHEAINSLLNATSRLASMSKQSRRFALQEYSVTTQARRYEALYQETPKG